MMSHLASNALVQLQAQYNHCDEVASEECLSAATFVGWRCKGLNFNELLDRYFDVAADLPEQRRSYITAGMHGNCGHAPIWMAELFVRPSLANFDEPEFLQPRNDFSRL